MKTVEDQPSVYFRDALYRRFRLIFTGLELKLLLLHVRLYAAVTPVVSSHKFDMYTKRNIKKKSKLTFISRESELRHDVSKKASETSPRGKVSVSSCLCSHDINVCHVVILCLSARIDTGSYLSHFFHSAFLYLSLYQ